MKITSFLLILMVMPYFGVPNQFANRNECSDLVTLEVDGVDSVYSSPYFYHDDEANGTPSHFIINYRKSHPGIVQMSALAWHSSREKNMKGVEISFEDDYDLIIPSDIETEYFGENYSHLGFFLLPAKELERFKKFKVNTYKVGSLERTLSEGEAKRLMKIADCFLLQIMK